MWGRYTHIHPITHTQQKEERELKKIISLKVAKNVFSYEKWLIRKHNLYAICKLCNFYATRPVKWLCLSAQGPEENGHPRQWERAHRIAPFKQELKLEILACLFSAFHFRASLNGSKPKFYNLHNFCFALTYQFPPSEINWHSRMIFFS